MNKVKRFDAGTIYGMYKTPEGYLRGIARVTRTGVFTYRNADGTLRRELRHPDEVFKADSMNTLKMIPMTNLHPSEKLVTAETAKRLSIGATGETVMPDGKFLTIPVKITADEGVKAAENGRDELSLGYECELDETPGTYNGEQYDCVQRNIEYNHLAIVDKGRAGPDVRLNMDADDGVEYTENNQNTPQSRRDAMSKLRLDNGLEYDAAPEVCVAFNQLKQEKNDALEQAKTSKADADKARADADTAKEDLKQYKERNNDAAIQKRIQERLALIEVAKTHLDEDTSAKLDGMSDLDIKKAVILAKYPKATLDGKSVDYIEARFDSAKEIVGDSAEEGGSSIASQRQTVQGRKDAADCTGGVEGKRKAMMDRMSSAYKGKEETTKK